MLQSVSIEGSDFPFVFRSLETIDRIYSEYNPREIIDHINALCFHNEGSTIVRGKTPAPLDISRGSFPDITDLYRQTILY